MDRSKRLASVYRPQGRLSPIAPEHHKYLCFSLLGGHFQFRCLPFGLASSPRTFTFLVVVIAGLRLRGIEISHYIDDLLVVARDPTMLTHHVIIVREVLEKFGWLINEAKSQIAPSQRMHYLGAQLDTRIGLRSLPRFLSSGGSLLSRRESSLVS